MAVVALALALHGRTVGFGFSHFDDDALVLAPQAAGRGAPSPWAALGQSYFDDSARDHAYYRPFVSASYALDAKVSGSRAWGYHATSVLLHAATGALLLLLLVSFGYSPGVALFGAAAFVAHPALAGAVAWIPGRDDLWLTLFALASWVSFRRARGSASVRARVVHGLTFLAALACKETAVVLPLLFAADAVVLERQRLREALRPWLLVAWGLPLGVSLLLRALVLGPGLGLTGLSGGELLGGLRGALSGLGALTVPAEPQVLAVPADMPLGRGLLTLLFFAGLLALAQERRRYLGFALAASFVLSLPSLPALSRLLLESRLYLPAVPLVIAACELARQSRFSEQARLALGAFVVGGLALSAFRHAGELGDPLTFAETASAGSPHSSLAHRNLGVAYQELGRTAQARGQYELALAADPSEPLVHNNLAVLLMAEGRLTEAEGELALELSQHPDSAEARQNLGLIARALGRSPARVSP